MTDIMSDDRLEVVLTDLADRVVISLEKPRRSRLRAVAAAGVVVLASMTISPVRDAAADVVELLSFRSIDFERGDSAGSDPAGLPPVTENAPTVQQAQAEAVIGQRLPETDLGPPDLIALPPEGGVLLVWNPGPTTLWILPTIDTADSRMRKLLDEVDAIEPVFELGEGAVFVHGDHVLTTPHRTVAADNVMLWIEGGVEYRLESNAELDQMLTTAKSLAQ